MSQYGPPGGGYPPQQPGGYPGQPGGYPSQGGYPGQPAGYGAAPGGYPGGMGGTPQLAGWGARFGAYFIDGLIQGSPVAIGGIVYAIAAAMSIDTSTGEVGGGFYVGICFMVVGGLASLTLGIMNRWVKGGKTGQTWGRKFLGIKLVGEQTGQPIGAGSAFVRDLCHMLDALPCYIGFLAPLWDDKNQTWADKIMKTLVVKA